MEKTITYKMHSGRIMFGKFKGMLMSLHNVNTTARSTTDLFKESMFNCLIHRFSF